MLSITTQSYLRMLAELLVFGLATFAVLFVLSVAQAQSATQAPVPLFREYRGVTLGMPKAEVQQRLGAPASSDDRQDVFQINDRETAQVFYDKQGRTAAFTINYLGDPKAPTPMQVFGAPAETREDGSVYKMVRYEAAGMWIIYTASAEQPPFVTIAVQKMR